MNKEVRRPSAQGAADLITREVIRNRLNAIVAQQSLVLKNVSGSPLVAEANDCNTGLYLPDGQIVCMAPHNIFFSGDYPREFAEIHEQKIAPREPTIYIAAINEWLRDDL